ncbi:MAG: HupE/UreJ family protein [Myxococcota bacterium]
MGRGAGARLLSALLVTTAVLGAAASAGAHPLRFGVLHLEERRDGTVDVSFRFSGTEDRPAGVDLRLPDRCRPVRAELRSPLAYGEQRRRTVRCGRRGLDGATIAVDGLEGRDVQIALRLERPGRQLSTATLSPGRASFTVPPRGPAPSPFGGYLAQGVRHILEGVDHLLFVLGLLLLVGLRWRLVGTLTAFTVGHSLTLALAVLGYAKVPATPVEAAIALSIVLLAAELAREVRARPDPPEPTLTRRYPGLVAGLFGLLHGLGFAGALSELGLAEDHLLVSLLGFNLGVELGQLLFVAVVLVGLAVARSTHATSRVPRHAATYALGALGVYFLLDRLAALA